MFERRESSLLLSPRSKSLFSSSESGFARFFGFGAAFAFGAALVVLRVVCLVAFGLGAAAAFFVGALAFCQRSLACEVICTWVRYDVPASPQARSRSRHPPRRRRIHPSSRSFPASVSASALGLVSKVRESDTAAVPSWIPTVKLVSGKRVCASDVSWCGNAEEKSRCLGGPGCLLTFGPPSNFGVFSRASGTSFQADSLHSPAERGHPLSDSSHEPRPNGICSQDRTETALRSRSKTQ